MPFTLAHPIAVVPLSRLLRRYVVLSALVIGSMTPDAPYFLALHIDRGDTHSLWGLVWFCLPLGCLVYAVFHGFLACPMAFVLPPALSERLTWNPAWGTLRVWWRVPPSIVLGTLTHIAWDACTHKYGYFVGRVPGLKVMLFRAGGYNFWVYKVLQYLSGIIGLALLSWLLWRWWKAAPIQRNVQWLWPDSWRRPLRLVMVVVPSMVAVLAAWRATDQLDFPMLLRHFVIIGGQAFLVTVAWVAVAWWVSAWWFRNQRPGMLEEDGDG